MVRDPLPSARNELGKLAAGKSGSTIQVINRALSVLEYLSIAEGAASLSDIARICDLHKSTVLRILRTLSQSGYTVYERDSRRWRLGPGILRLQAGARQRNDLRGLAQPAMLRLCDSLGETVQLANLVDDQVSYLEKVEPQRQEIRILSEPGSRRPIHCTGLGKVLLSGLPDRTCDDVIRRLRFQVFTERTITNPVALKKQVQKAQRDGYAIDNREFNRAVICAAAPVRDANGVIIAGLSVSAVGLDADSPIFANIVDGVKSTADELSQALGWQGGGVMP